MTFQLHHLSFIMNSTSKHQLSPFHFSLFLNDNYDK
eukprot:UN02591